MKTFFASLVSAIAGIVAGSLFEPAGDAAKCYIKYGVSNLQIAGSDYERGPNGLSKAIADGRVDVVRLFVGPCGFDKDLIYTTGQNKFTPLWLAASLGKPVIVKMLLEAGASCFFAPAGNENVTFKQAVEDLTKQGSDFVSVRDAVWAGCKFGNT